MTRLEANRIPRSALACCLVGSELIGARNVPGPRVKTPIEISVSTRNTNRIPRTPRTAALLISKATSAGNEMRRENDVGSILSRGRLVEVEDVIHVDAVVHNRNIVRAATTSNVNSLFRQCTGSFSIGSLLRSLRGLPRSLSKSSISGGSLALRTNASDRSRDGVTRLIGESQNRWRLGSLLKTSRTTGGWTRFARRKVRNLDSTRLAERQRNVTSRTTHAVAHQATTKEVASKSTQLTCGVRNAVIDGTAMRTCARGNAAFRIKRLESAHAVKRVNHLDIQDPKMLEDQHVIKGHVAQRASGRSMSRTPRDPVAL